MEIRNHSHALSDLPQDPIDTRSPRRVTSADLASATSVRATNASRQLATTSSADLGGDSADLRSASVLGNRSDDVRTGKVEAVRAAIAAGTYGVDASAIAERLIAELRTK
jgi:flagellar biosynthesis anti-sigma factor FlgM